MEESKVSTQPKSFLPLLCGLVMLRRCHCHPTIKTQNIFITPKCSLLPECLLKDLGEKSPIPFLAACFTCGVLAFLHRMVESKPRFPAPSLIPGGRDNHHHLLSIRCGQAAAWRPSYIILFYHHAQPVLLQMRKQSLRS